MLLPLLALVAGIVIGGISPWCGLAAAIAAAICFISRQVMAASCCLILAFGVGNRIVHEPMRPQLNGTYRIAGAVTATGMSRTGHLWLQLRIDSVNSQPSPTFEAKIYTPEVMASVRPGEYISLNADFKPEGIHILRGSALQVLGEAPGLRARCQRWHSQLVMRLLSANISPESFALINAMLLGNTAHIPSSMRGNFAASGIAHILALSGTHVAAIALLASMLLWPLYVARRSRSRLLITALMLWAYACLTGLTPSVLRAVVMFSVYAIGSCLQWRTMPLNTLLFAAFIILCVAPFDLYSISFQLSFAAVAGILIFTPLYNPINRRRHPWLYSLCSYPAVSLAAMTFTCVISAHYFSSFPPYFLVANILVLPLVPLLILMGIFALLMPHNAIICTATSALSHLIIDLSECVASLPGGRYYFPLDTMTTIAMLVLIFVAAICFHRLKLRESQRQKS